MKLPTSRDQADVGLVQRHGSGLHAEPADELFRQAREPVVEQAVEALLDQVGHLGDGDCFES